MVLGGFILAAAGMALFPFSVSFGIGGVIAAIVVLYTGINIQRSPVQALIADLVPSRYRSLATGSVTFQMCVGAVVFLMLGRCWGCGRRSWWRSITVLAIAATFKVALREPAARDRRRLRRRPLRSLATRCGRRSAASCRVCARSSPRRFWCS